MKNRSFVSLDDDEGLYEEKHTADWSAIPHKSAENEELKAILDEAIQKLSPDYRMIFLLRDIEGMSYEEYRKKVLQSKEKSAQVMSVISTFYHIGWLVKMKLLDINAVMGFTFDIVAVYDVVIPHLVRFGEEPGTPYNPGQYPYFTYLYDEIKKQRETQKK